MQGTQNLIRSSKIQQASKLKMNDLQPKLTVKVYNIMYNTTIHKNRKQHAWNNN